jgi:hypothetical protein
VPATGCKYGLKRAARNVPPGGGLLAVQRHHLLPLGLRRVPGVGVFMSRLASSGFSLDDGHRNGLWLPATEDAAAALGMAMHRGPHPHYSAVVAERVERTARLHRLGAIVDAQALARLDRLQAVLTRLLAGRGPRLVLLNTRDPLGLFSDYSYLDAAITAQWQPAPDDVVCDQ